MNYKITAEGGRRSIYIDICLIYLYERLDNHIVDWIHKSYIHTHGWRIRSSDSICAGSYISVCKLEVVLVLVVLLLVFTVVVMMVMVVMMAMVVEMLMIEMTVVVAEVPQLPTPNLFSFLSPRLSLQPPCPASLPLFSLSSLDSSLLSPRSLNKEGACLPSNHNSDPCTSWKRHQSRIIIVYLSIDWEPETGSSERKF